MPIYEYVCPQCHTRSEKLTTVVKGRFGRCPNCKHRAYRVPSVCSYYWLNWTQADGEGYTTNFVRHEELAEINQDCRER